MPATRHGIGENILNGQAKECIALYAVMGGYHTRNHLNQHQSAYHPNVFQHGTHGRSGFKFPHRVRFGCPRHMLLLMLCIVVNQNSHTEEQQQHTKSRPEMQRGGCNVAYYGVVWPVVGIANVAVGPVGYTYPARPCEESVHLIKTLFGRKTAYRLNRFLAHSIRIAQLSHRGVVQEQLSIIVMQLFGHPSAHVAKSDDARLRIISILTELFLQQHLVLSLVRFGQLGIHFTVFLGQFG